MYAKVMQIRTIIRAIVFIIRDKKSAKVAFEESVAITRMEINWTKVAQGKNRAKK